MSKNLVIIRHGKATRDYPNINDIDRPLKEPGILATISVAQKLKDQNILPDCMLSSPANRALHTCYIMARELGFPYEKIIINQEIYTKSENEILRIIQSVDKQFSSLFIFGHNPTVTSISNLFLRQQIDNIPTSGAVLFEFDIRQWSDIAKAAVKTNQFYFPKEL